MNISQIEIGIQANIIDPKSPVIKHNMLDIFERMATSEKLKNKTIKVRTAKTKEEKDKFKKDLHGIIVSSSTTTRKKVDGDVHTGFMWADIDKFEGDDNPDKTLTEGIAIVEDLCKDYPYLIGYFISPSGNGIKVLCAIEPDVESHKMSFKAVSDLFDANGLNVDQSGSDAKRICYVCYDPNIRKTLINPLSAWTGERIKPAKKKEVVKYVYKGTNSSDLSPDDEAGLCLQHISPDIDYEEWIRVGMGLKEHGCSCGVWDSWSSGSQLYKQGECERKWASFSGSGVGFGSIVNMAKDGNGGKSPITAAKNQREPIKVTADDFDEIAVDDEQPAQDPNYYYHNGKYYMLDSTGTRYIGIGSEDLTRQLRSLGYSNKGEEGEMSAIDKVKASIVKNNTVDAVGQLAGRSIGLMEDKINGMRHLVQRKNKRIEAKEGNWDQLRVMLEGLYAEQLPYFYSWLHRARRQLIEEQFMMGHALALAGKRGGGKSLTAEKIIAPLLGSKAKAHRYLTGATEFNADLCGSELLILDDEGGSRSMVDRKKMGNSLKESTAGSSSVSRHGKGFDAYTVSPLWRIVVCMNDDADAIGAFPPLGEGDCDSLGDKVLLLKCYTTELPFSRDKNSFAMMDRMIEDALPAFAYFLDNYEIPEDIRTGLCRFGFDEYHHPELLGTLNLHSNPRTMLSATDWLLFSGQGYHGFDMGNREGRCYYDVKAIDWGMALLNKDANLPHRMKNTIEGELFGINATQAGKCMKAMSEVSNGRVTQVSINGTRWWRIWKDDTVDSADPF